MLPQRLVLNSCLLRAPMRPDTLQIAELANNPNVATQPQICRILTAVLTLVDWIAAANEKPRKTVVPMSSF